MSSIDKAEVLKKKGNTEFQNGNYIAALQSYTSAIDLVEDKTFYSNRAFCYLKLKKYKQCMNDCTQALTIDPNFAKAWGRRGEASLILGNVQAAIADYIKALNVEPNNITLKKGMEYAELMKSYEKDLVQVTEEGDIEAAIRKIEIILEGCTEYTDMELKRMELWNNNGDMDKTLNR